MSMPDPVMVICIDGPTRGKLRAVTGGSRTRFQVYDMSVQTIPDHGGEDTTLPAIYYHVHQIYLLDFITRIASIQINQDNIDPYDIISCLYSEAGRQATYRVNGG